MSPPERPGGRTKHALRRTPIETGAPAWGRAPCWARTPLGPMLWERLPSLAGHLGRQRAVGPVHRVGHRDEHFAWPLEGLPAMRGADVVHEHQVAGLPRLPYGVCLMDLVDHFYHTRADRGAVTEAGIEWQSVLTVDVHEVLANLRLDRPLAEEGDLVEPAPLAGERVSHDGAAALPGAQCAVGSPLEPDRVGTTVALDGGAVVGPERSGDRRPDVVVVVPDQEPAHPLETLDQLGGERVKHGRRVSHRGSTPGRWRDEAGKQHEAGELERVTELVVHAHGLVGWPIRGGVHAQR